MKKIGLIFVMVMILFWIGWTAWIFLETSSKILTDVSVPQWPLNTMRVVWVPVYMGVIIAVIAILGIIALCALYTLFSLRR